MKTKLQEIKDLLLIKQLFFESGNRDLQEILIIEEARFIDLFGCDAYDRYAKIDPVK